MLSVILYSLILPALAAYLSVALGVVRLKSDFKPKDRVLLVIAHPDDECMFFAPTILQLTQRIVCEVYLLCLSNGNANGYGKTRETELKKSAKVLGIKSENVFIVDAEDLQDGMVITWYQERVAEEIKKIADLVNPSHVISFDERGVSGHSNHISAYSGLALYSQQNSTVKTFKLNTVSTLRKYCGVFDILLTLSHSPSTHIFVSTPAEALQAQSAMFKHKSQLLWFRYLYILFSRYMYMNDLIQIQ